MLLAASALRPNPAVAPSELFAVRAGILTFLGTLAIGAAMIAIGTVAARTQSQQAAYTAATPLKWAHFATMHGILVLPAVAWWTGRSGWPEARRAQAVRLVTALYVLAAGAVVAASVVALTR
ncbi:hypothetical protein ACIB24_21480 [Spongisporangium articulatum]|uniref:DUF420 domain-containing protein n=1 Tax=Spongisporangium articulatum TaxID=3362603 RepID=A0ABW8ATC8_9ACTN